LGDLARRPKRKPPASSHAPASDRLADADGSRKSPPVCSASLRIALWTCAAIAACGARHGAPSDRFVPVADGLVLDARTHLEWTSRDHAQSLAWGDADRLCRGSSRDGRTGWRLPEIGELQALYDARFDEACGDRRCHL